MSIPPLNVEATRRLRFAFGSQHRVPLGTCRHLCVQSCLEQPSGGSFYPTIPAIPATLEALLFIVLRANCRCCFLVHRTVLLLLASVVLLAASGRASRHPFKPAAACALSRLIALHGACCWPLSWIASLLKPRTTGRYEDVPHPERHVAAVGSSRFPSRAEARPPGNVQTPNPDGVKVFPVARA